MCGIAGIVNLDGASRLPRSSRWKRMVSAIRYRGPDEFGVFRDGQAALVTRGCQSSTSPPASSP